MLMTSPKQPAPVRIGNRLLGDGEPCYVIAEIGNNHNGDFDRAIAAAREAEALAKASIFQAMSEKEAWKAMEIR